LSQWHLKPQKIKRAGTARQSIYRESLEPQRPSAPRWENLPENYQ
jgi:hypothetical protein